MKTFIIALLIIYLIPIEIISQDKIIFNTNSQIEVKVVKISNKYTYYEDLNAQYNDTIKKLLNSGIKKIIYNNGQIEDFKIYEIYYDKKKNTIEVFLTEAILNSLSLSYNRQVGKKINLRTQYSYSFNDPKKINQYSSVNQYFTFQSLFFPYGHIKIAPYTGLEFRYGSYTSYKYYSNFSYDRVYTSGYNTSIENFINYGLLIGLEVNVSQKISFSSFASIGIGKTRNFGKFNSYIYGGVSLGYKF